MCGRRFFGRCLILTPSLLWVIAVCYFEGLYLFLSVTLAAAFHECGHLLAFSVLGLPSPRLVPVTRGFRLATSQPLSYRQEGWIAAAGPIANLTCTAVGVLLGAHFPALDSFGQISLMTALCNLIPFSGLDGERILRCMVAPHIGARTLYYASRLFSATVLYFGLFGTLLYLWITGEGTYPALLCLAACLTLPLDADKKRGKSRIHEHF